MLNESNIIINAEMYEHYRISIEEGLAFYKNPNEQENKMETVNTKVFEYCIINFHDSGAPEVVVGPEVIATLGEENPRDVALLRIGRRHADIINEDSEVQIRPFC